MPNSAFREDETPEMEIKRERMDEIERLSVKYDAPIVVLFDCDTAGRQLRNAFLTRFPRATHAFMGAFESSAKEDGTWHARGNVGVEHGEGEDIARAIARARRADPERRAFTRADLVERGLVADDAVGDGCLGRVRRRRRASTSRRRTSRRRRLRRSTVIAPTQSIFHRRRGATRARSAPGARRTDSAQDDGRSRRQRLHGSGRRRRFPRTWIRSDGVRTTGSGASGI